MIAVLLSIAFLAAACGAEEPGPDHTGDAANDEISGNSADSPGDNGDEGGDVVEIDPAESGDDDDASAREAPADFAPEGPRRTDMEEIHAQELELSDCGEFQCGSITVPKDYLDLEGDELDLETVIRPADGEETEGALLVDLGTETTSPEQRVAEAAELLDDEVLETYDLMALERRAIHGDSRLACLDDLDLDDVNSGDLNTPQLHDGTAEGDAPGNGSVCEDANRAELVDAYAAVRDLDVLRELRGGLMNQFTQAEGSYMALLHLDVFREESGRLVLDGVPNPAFGGAEISRFQAQAHQELLDDALQDAGAESIPEEVAADPVAMTGVIYGLRDPDLSEDLHTALESATEGDVSALHDLTAEILGSGDQVAPDSGSADSAEELNLESAVIDSWAMHCLNRPTSSEDDVEALDSALEETPTVASWYASREGLCAALTEGHEEPAPRRIQAAGTGGLLALRGTEDPVMDPEWGERLAESQLISAVPVIYEGSGHGAYGRTDCLDDVVLDYLHEGTTPESGFTC